MKICVHPVILPLLTAAFTLSCSDSGSGEAPATVAAITTVAQPLPGETPYQANCAKCHDEVMYKAPSRFILSMKYSADYKLILAGDATMRPYEIEYPVGSVEHWNEEAGTTWMKRLLDLYPKAIWLNPVPIQRWEYTPSIQLLPQLMEQRMYPLTASGLEQGMRTLS